MKRVIIDEEGDLQQRKRILTLKRNKVSREPKLVGVSSALDNKQRKNTTTTMDNQIYDNKRTAGSISSGNEMKGIIDGIASCSITSPQSSSMPPSSDSYSSTNKRSASSSSGSSSSSKSSIEQILDAGKDYFDYIDKEIMDLIEGFDALLNMDASLDNSNSQAPGGENKEAGPMNEDIIFMGDDTDQLNQDFYDYIAHLDYNKNDRLSEEGYRRKLLGGDYYQSFSLLENRYEELYDGGSGSENERGSDNGEESDSDSDDSSSPTYSACGEQHR